MVVKIYFTTALFDLKVRKRRKRNACKDKTFWRN